MCDATQMVDLVQRAKGLSGEYVNVGLNDKNEAFRWLGRAYEERTMRLEQITEPTFDGLRSDPRLIHLKALIGLPPS